RGGPADRRLGIEPAGHRRRRGPARPRRRLDDRLPGDPDPLQPDPRGPLHPDRGRDRPRGRAPPRRRRRERDGGAAMARTAVQDVAMPRLSDSMEEGTVLSWLKQVGDEVAIGEELVEIETDKANMGYEADVAGTLLEIVVGENETAPVGAVIARIGDPGTELPSDPAPGAPASTNPSSSVTHRVTRDEALPANDRT